jgi:muramoyltetrapeptide carboxypeptidase
MSSMNKTLTIGIFATSSPLGRDKSENDFSYLKSKGLDIVESSSLRTRTYHTAGSVEERVNNLHTMVSDPNIDILMAYWGGANTNQLLPYLNYELFKNHAKPIIGFSDTSALLLAVNKLSQIKTYLGPAGITFDKPEPFEYSYDYFKKTVIDCESEIIIEDSSEYADDLYFLNPDPTKRIKKENPGRKIFKQGKAKGQILASNLQTLLVLAGTKYFPDLSNKVLFVEEDESTDTQMVHRFLTHLSQVTDLNSLRGICIGRFMSQTGFSEKDPEEEVYKDVFKDLNIT